MIDDDQGVLDTVRDHVAANAAGATFVGEVNFANAQNRIGEVRPDVLILDVYRGTPATEDVAAQPVWTELWKDWFCPLVFYSAGEIDVDPAPPDDHPFIRKIQKGRGSEALVLQEITGFKPHIDALRSFDDELEKVTHSVLRDVATHIFKVEGDEGKRKEMMIRLARRRVAAAMDGALSGSNDSLHPWEQYIHPPLVSHLVVGDILRITEADWRDVSAYRVVLTPTCDMVPYGTPPSCKVQSVLAVKSCDPKIFASRGLNLGATPTEKTLKEKLRTAFNDPHQSGLGILPEYPGIVPLLGLDFRQLELIPVGDIATGNEKGKRLTRVASIDSPFREFVAWAFLQISCRPGIPPRNMDSVAAALVACFTAPLATDGAK